MEIERWCRGEWMVNRWNERKYGKFWEVTFLFSLNEKEKVSLNIDGVCVRRGEIARVGKLRFPVDVVGMAVYFELCYHLAVSCINEEHFEYFYPIRDEFGIHDTNVG